MLRPKFLIVSPHGPTVEEYFLCLGQSFSLYNFCCSLADLRFVIRSYGFVLHRLHVSKHLYYIRWVHKDGYKNLIRVRGICRIVHVGR